MTTQEIKSYGIKEIDEEITKAEVLLKYADMKIDQSIIARGALATEVQRLWNLRFEMAKKG